MGTTLMIGASTLSPYQYVDQAGNVAGSDSKLVQDAFATAGYEIEICLDNWPKIEAAIKSGKLHGAFQVEQTQKRSLRYYFSLPLHQYHSMVVTGNPYLCRLMSFDEIIVRRLTIGVLLNDAYDTLLDKVDDCCKQYYAEPADLLSAVSRDEIDLGIIDRQVKTHLQQKGRFDNLWAIDELNIERSLHVIFNDSTLRDAFNSGLRTLNNRCNHDVLMI